MHGGAGRSGELDVSQISFVERYNLLKLVSDVRQLEESEKDKVTDTRMVHMKKHLDRHDV